MEKYPCLALLYTFVTVLECVIMEKKYSGLIIAVQLKQKSQINLKSLCKVQLWTEKLIMDPIDIF